MLRFRIAAGVWILACMLLLPVSAYAQHVQIEGGARYESLAEALAAARPGEVLVVEGTHRGNFTIDRPLTLRGGAVAVLDGGSEGTVLVIAADDVRVEDLAVTRSGLSDDFWQAWGHAGIRVEGNRAVLSGLDVANNGWGVLFRAGQGSELRMSQVLDNQRDGVMVMGGADHAIRSNRIMRNRNGIVLDSYYGDNNRVLLALIHDPQWNQQVAALQAQAVPGLRQIVEDNDLRGNASNGIRLQFHVNESRVQRNTVHGTGIERPSDPDERAFWERELRSTLFVPVEMDGSGIVIYCWPEDNLVADNHVFENLANGIYLSIAPHNRIERNRIDHNAIGIEVSHTQDSVIRENTVTENTDFGIRAGGWLWMGQGRPDRNLIVLNSLIDNGVNAYDGSDRLLSTQEIADHFALMPWPEEMRVIYDNPAYRLRMAQAMVDQQHPGHNRWDDGVVGNHHSDFDVPEEGFVDRNGDGIGEVGRAIPGGAAVDHFPLTPAALTRALTEAQTVDSQGE